MKKITVGGIVNKPIQQVWDFWTSPEHIVNWNFASPDWHCPQAEHNMAIGGKLKYTMAAKDGSMQFDYTGTFTQIEPNKLLAYQLDDGREVTITFIEQGDSTEVAETFELETINSEELQRQGWQAIFNQFKGYVETN